ncbi:hypothetical protein GJS33_08990 [Streptococcus equi subsp. zooepidemicus]|nr:hypothetical protein GJS33_08990 [Streptococcus equi subsp. zooepidemicus]
MSSPAASLVTTSLISTCLNAAMLFAKVMVSSTVISASSFVSNSSTNHTAICQNSQRIATIIELRHSKQLGYKVSSSLTQKASQGSSC